MKPANLVKLVVIILLIAITGYFVARYIVNLPTKQEKVLVSLLEDFERGDYKGASEFCKDNSMFQVIGNSTVIDTDGEEIRWKSGGFRWDETTVSFAIQTYVKRYLYRMKFTDLSTQELEGGRAVVAFGAELSVVDPTRGDRVSPALHNGFMRGECHMSQDENGDYKVEKFAITMESLGDVSLKYYLQQM